jgi:hypothetical protein
MQQGPVFYQQHCFKNGEQEAKTGPVWELVPVCVWEIQKVECGGNMYSCMKMEK